MSDRLEHRGVRRRPEPTIGLVEDMTLAAGTRLGSYEVSAPIGAGGMGEVYRARDLKLGRDVAIKVLASSFTRDPERRRRFDREARILAALNHPGIASIYGYEASDGVDALILEFVDGPTLAERLTHGPFDVRDALTIGHQIADALAAAHAKGIIHRDLKPANVKLASDGRVKVLDFGLAKTFDEGSNDVVQAALPTVTETHAGALLGTVAYMSPEQARGQRIDRQTDVWAFGCVLFEMLTGRLAFDGATTPDVFAQILEHEPQLDTLPDRTPAPVRQLIGQCLKKNRTDRLLDLADARLTLQETLNLLSPTPSAPARRFPARWLAVAAVLLIGIGGWIAIPRFMGGSGEPRLSDGNRPSANAEANAYYERSLLFGGVGTADHEQAQRMIERALQHDPAFAAARAEFAFFHVVPILSGRSYDASLFYTAETEARRALSNDPRCGRAHSVLALVYLLQGRKELVLGELEQALGENPNDPTALGWSVHFHQLNGDYDRALEQVDRLIRLWPLYWPARLNRGELLREQGDLAGAVREQERVLEQVSDNVDALTSLARAYIDSGDLPRARQTLERARAEQRQNFFWRGGWALLLAREGQRSAARAEMDETLQAYSAIQIFGPSAAADFYAATNDSDAALTWLDRAVRLGDDREEYLRRNPLLQNLRAHPRFQQILDSVSYRRQQRQAR